MINWQPIETAPKDGTVIVVWANWPNTLRGTVEVVSYNEDRGLSDVWGLGPDIDPSFWTPFSMPASPPLSDLAYWEGMAHETITKITRAVDRRWGDGGAVGVYRELNRYNSLRAIAAKEDTTC